MLGSSTTARSRDDLRRHLTGGSARFRARRAPIRACGRGPWPASATFKWLGARPRDFSSSSTRVVIYTRFRRQRPAHAGRVSRPSRGRAQWITSLSTVEDAIVDASSGVGVPSERYPRSEVGPRRACRRALRPLSHISRRSGSPALDGARRSRPAVARGERLLMLAERFRGARPGYGPVAEAIAFALRRRRSAARNVCFERAILSRSTSTRAAAFALRHDFERSRPARPFSLLRASMLTLATACTLQGIRPSHTTRTSTSGRAAPYMIS